MRLDEGPAEAEIDQMTEAVVRVVPSVSENILNTSFYPRIRVLEIPEIMRFCQEQISLKNDLLDLTTYIGEYMTEAQIREIFDTLKEKYNQEKIIGMEYHVESTRIDFGVVLFVVIKRTDIFVKKFIFRFRKALDTNLVGLSSIGVPIGGINLPELQKEDRARETDALLGRTHDQK